MNLLVMKIKYYLFPILAILIFTIISCQEKKDAAPPEPPLTINEFGIVIDSLTEIREHVKINQTITEILLPYAPTSFQLQSIIQAGKDTFVTARVAERIMPAPREETGPRYLDAAVLDEPRWALGLARREVVRISDEVLVIGELSARELRRGNWDGGAIRARETRTDHLARAVVRYLADLRQQHGPDPTSEWLFTWVTELETVARLLRRVEQREDKLRDAGVTFSRAGRRELADACDALLARMRNAFTAMAVGHKGLARQVVDGRPDYERLIAEFRLAHLARLEARLPATRMSHMQHLEILALLRQIDASVTRIGGLVLAEEGNRPTPDR